MWATIWEQICTIQFLPYVNTGYYKKAQHDFVLMIKAIAKRRNNKFALNAQVYHKFDRDIYTLLYVACFVSTSKIKIVQHFSFVYEVHGYMIHQL